MKTSIKLNFASRVIAIAVAATTLACAAAHAQSLPTVPAQIIDALKVLPLPACVTPGAPTLSWSELVSSLNVALKPEVAGSAWLSARRCDLALHVRLDAAGPIAFAVIEKPISLTSLPNLGGAVWGKLGNATLNVPIFSLSLSSAGQVRIPPSDLPPSLVTAMTNTGKYGGLSAITVDVGAQLFSHAAIGGALSTVLKTALNAPVDNFWLRAGMTVQAPAATNQAKTQQSENAIRNSNLANRVLAFRAAQRNVARASTDGNQSALFMEILMPPGAVWKGPLLMTELTVSDATIYMDDSVSIGFMGNVSFATVPGKSFVTSFEIPLTEANTVDWSEAQLAMSSPGTISMEDFAKIAIALNSQASGASTMMEFRPAQAVMDNMQKALYPLSAFTIQNPNAGNVRFAAGAPFPNINLFNIVLLSKNAVARDGTKGPLLIVRGSLGVLGQNFADTDTKFGKSGLASSSKGGFNLNLSKAGLGSPGFDVTAKVLIDQYRQQVELGGRLDVPVLARNANFSFANNRIAFSSPATCVVPLEIGGGVALRPNIGFDDVMGAISSFSIDPKFVANCTAAQVAAMVAAVEDAAKFAALEAAKAAQEAAKAAEEAAKFAAKALEDAGKLAISEASQACSVAANAAAGAITNVGTQAVNEIGNGVKDIAGKAARGAQDAVNEVLKTFKVGSGTTTCDHRYYSVGAPNSGKFPDVGRTEYLLNLHTTLLSSGLQGKNLYFKVANDNAKRGPAHDGFKAMEITWNAWAKTKKDLTVPTFAEFHAQPIPGYSGQTINTGGYEVKSFASRFKPLLAKQLALNDAAVETTYLAGWKPYVDGTWMPKTTAEHQWWRCATAARANTPMFTSARLLKVGLPNDDIARILSPQDYATQLAGFADLVNKERNDIQAQADFYRDFSQRWPLANINIVNAIYQKLNKDLLFGLPRARVVYPYYLDPIQKRGKAASEAATRLWYPVQNAPAGFQLKRVQNEMNDLRTKLAQQLYERHRIVGNPTEFMAAKVKEYNDAREALRVLGVNLATLNNVPIDPAAAARAITRATTAYDTVLATQANELVAEKAAEKFAVAQVDLDRLEILVQQLEGIVAALSR